MFASPANRMEPNIGPAPSAGTGALRGSAGSPPLGDALKSSHLATGQRVTNQNSQDLHVETPLARGRAVNDQSFMRGAIERGAIENDRPSRFKRAPQADAESANVGQSRSLQPASPTVSPSAAVRQSGSQKVSDSQVSTPPVAPPQNNLRQARPPGAGIFSGTAVVTTGPSANSRPERSQRGFLILQRPAPYVASYHQLNAPQLHHRLNSVLTGGEFEQGGVRHTSSWLKGHQLGSWWSTGNSPYWAWGLTGLSGLNSWLGDNWYADARPFIYYAGGRTLLPFVDAVEIPDQLIALGDAALTSEGGWIPLGVFGLLPPGATEYAATIQLSVNRNGAVRGYAVETATGQVYEAIGGFDPSKLRIAWTFPGDGSLRFETTAGNLLQGESLVNVYDPVDRSVGVWQVVRDIPEGRS
jgi:hypothetical protein